MPCRASKKNRNVKVTIAAAGPFSLLRGRQLGGHSVKIWPAANGETSAHRTSNLKSSEKTIVRERPGGAK